MFDVFNWAFTVEVKGIEFVSSSLDRVLHFVLGTVVIMIAECCVDDESVNRASSKVLYTNKQPKRG
jgi:hypothetical protein